ncbi:MAG: hypothetical protein K2M19_04770 [Muribaculaceae bacterium]|nr:hypothetical protein [Muribaculaceae bacterium]
MKNTRILAAVTALSVTGAITAYRTETFTLANSEIYPGTTHEVILTLSDGYRPDSTALLYVGLDGILCRAPQVFDSLAAAGELRPVVGVYLQPGIIRDSVSGSVLRYNRSNEFDAITDRFAEFLDREVLPAVRKHGFADGTEVNWTDDAADHLIFGLSSGGIAAFNAAWHRPDMWGKVFIGCGTFVPMRGGEQLQVLVRKTEPKPLKIFLQDGFSDTWNPLFGSWYEANRMLASALEFAGYDCSFDWAEGGHSVRRATEIFPETVKWLYSAPVAPNPTGNDFLAPLLVSGQSWNEKTLTDRADEVKATADYPGGGLRVTVEPESNVLLQSIIDVDGSEKYTQPFYWLHSIDGRVLAKGGMTFDSGGNLWIVTSAGLQILDQNGRVRGIIVLPAGLDINSTNIRLTDGAIELNDGHHVFVRRLNTAPGIVRPNSQGQG